MSSSQTPGEANHTALWAPSTVELRGGTGGKVSLVEVQGSGDFNTLEIV